MTARTTTASGHGVGISLISGAETSAIQDQLRRTQPHVEIADRGVYLKATAAEEIVIDLADLSEQLGRPLDIENILVVVTTYFGEIDPQRGATPGTGRLVLRAEHTPITGDPRENN